jgi:hypothetical protein
LTARVSRTVSGEARDTEHADRDPPGDHTARPPGNGQHANFEFAVKMPLVGYILLKSIELQARVFVDRRIIATAVRSSAGTSSTAGRCLGWPRFR